jgi:hypothetical protein
MLIPLRNLAKRGVQISALGLSGHHLGGANHPSALGRVQPVCNSNEYQTKGKQKWQIKPQH